MKTIKDLLAKAGVSREAFMKLTWDGFVTENAFVTSKYDSQKNLVWSNKCYARFDLATVTTEDLMDKATAQYKVDAQRPIRNLTSKGCQDLMGDQNAPYTFMAAKPECTDPNERINRAMADLQVLFGACKTLAEAEELAETMGLNGVPAYVAKKLK
jgi:cell division septation protein DedD